MEILIKIIATIVNLITGLDSVCSVAKQFSVYKFDDLLWFLYLITAQAIHYRVIDVQRADVDEKVRYLSTLIQPVVFFMQLSKIISIMQKINHNISMNQDLVLEDLLLGYLVMDL